MAHKINRPLVYNHAIFVLEDVGMYGRILGTKLLGAATIVLLVATMVVINLRASGALASSGSGVLELIRNAKSIASAVFAAGSPRFYNSVLELSIYKSVTFKTCRKLEGVISDTTLPGGIATSRSSRPGTGVVNA